MRPVYLVVGGGNGLGAATAMGLARKGADVIISDLGTRVDGSEPDPEPAREVAAEIKAEIDGASAVAHFGDAADAVDAGEAIETTLKAFG